MCLLAQNMLCRTGPPSGPSPAAWLSHCSAPAIALQLRFQLQLQHPFSPRMRVALSVTGCACPTRGQGRSAAGVSVIDTTVASPGDPRPPPTPQLQHALILLLCTHCLTKGAYSPPTAARVSPWHAGAYARGMAKGGRNGAVQRVMCARGTHVTLTRLRRPTGTFFAPRMALRPSIGHERANIVIQCREGQL